MRQRFLRTETNQRLHNAHNGRQNRIKHAHYRREFKRYKFFVFNGKGFWGQFGEHDGNKTQRHYHYGYGQRISQPFGNGKPFLKHRGKHFVCARTAGGRGDGTHQRNANLYYRQAAFHMIFHEQGLLGAQAFFLGENGQFRARNGCQRHFIGGQQGI